MINLEETDHNTVNTRPIATDSIKISILTTYGDCKQKVLFDNIKFYGESHNTGKLYIYLKQ